MNSYSWIKEYTQNNKWQRYENVYNASVANRIAQKSKNYRLQNLLKLDQKRVLQTLGEYWYHTIDVDGDKIQGVYDMTPFVDIHFQDVNMSGLNVLEIGCADGFLSIEMAKRGAIVTAIEAWQLMASHTKFLAEISGVDVNIICDDFHNDSVLSHGEKFDVILCSHVLCHHSAAGRDHMIKKVKNVLSTTGTFICSSNRACDLEDLETQFVVTKRASYKLPQLGTVTVLSLKTA